MYIESDSMREARKIQKFMEEREAVYSQMKTWRTWTRADAAAADAFETFLLLYHYPAVRNLVFPSIAWDSLAEETIKAAKVDAERALQCGISVTDEQQPRECWRKQLETPKNASARRLQALKALVESDPQNKEYTYIIGLLEDSDQSIREGVTNILVKNSKEAVLPLVDELKHNPNDNVKAAIVSVLAKIGKPAVSGLIENLKPQYPLEVRRYVVQALGELVSQEGQVTNDSLKALEEQKNEEIRPEAEEVIRKIQEKGKQLPPASASRPARPAAPK